MNAGQPLRPANMVNIVEINRGKRPYTMIEPRSAELAVHEFMQHMVISPMRTT